MKGCHAEYFRYEAHTISSSNGPGQTRLQYSPIPQNHEGFPGRREEEDAHGGGLGWIN